MRITLSSQANTASYLIDSSYTELVKYQEQVASGKRISKPSDDPVATNQTLSYSHSISNIDQYLSNANLATDFGSQTQTVLDELYNQLQQVKSIGLSANTASATAESRAASADKLDSIATRLVELANTTHLGRYIFSGQRTNASPLAHVHTFSSSAAVTPASVTGSADLSGGVSLASPAHLILNDASGSMLADVTLTNGMTSAQVAQAINTAAGAGSLTPPHAVSATIDSNNHLVLSNTTSGYGPVVAVSASSDAAALGALGLAAGIAHGSGGFTPQGTAGTLTINGIGITVNANDTSTALVQRINLQSSITKVTASVDAGGKISLAQTDSASSNAMSVAASGGYTLDNIFGTGASEAVNTSYTYAGDDNSIKMQTGQFSMETVNRTADKLFNLNGAASGSEPDVFTLISNLKSAILSGTQDQMNQQLSLVDSATSRVEVQRVDVGAKLQNLSGLIDNLNSTQDNLKQLRSNTEDADVTEAMVNFQAQQQVYQASLYSASSLFKLSLMDFLR